MKAFGAMQGTLIDKLVRSKEVFSILDLGQDTKPFLPAFPPTVHGLVADPVIVFTTDYRIDDVYSSHPRTLIVDYQVGVFTVYEGFIIEVNTHVEYDANELYPRTTYRFNTIHQEDFRPSVFVDLEVSKINEICRNAGHDITSPLVIMRDRIQHRLATRVREKYERFD